MTTEHLDEPSDPHERAVLRRKAIDACTLCDDEGYIPSGPFLVCDHVDRDDTNRRGMALVRKALEGKPNNPAVLHRQPLNPLPPAPDPCPVLDNTDDGRQLSGTPTVDPEPEI